MHTIFHYHEIYRGRYEVIPRLGAAWSIMPSSELRPPVVILRVYLHPLNYKKMFFFTDAISSPITGLQTKTDFSSIHHMTFEMPGNFRVGKRFSWSMTAVNDIKNSCLG